LNTAINQLRNALGDDAANPRFIQTLPRRGYRFIAPVEIAAAGEKMPAATPANGDGARSTAEAPRSTVLSDARDLPAVSRATAHTLFLLIQLIYVTFYVIALARLREVDALLTRSGDPVRLILVVLIVTAAAGIPIRLYLISAAAFSYQGLAAKFQKLFAFLLPLDELWALAPFLAVEKIGFGVALAATAALLYLPFAQRSLLLMGSQR
jgi:cholera toxin transcriptional activator